MKNRVALNLPELLEIIAAHNLSEKVQKALQIAHDSHKEQTRDSGHSYLEEHIYYVAKLTVEHFSNEFNFEDLLIAAILHDSIEDSDLYTLQDIEKLFGADVATTVGLLTKPPKETNYNGTHEEKFALNKAYLERLLHNASALKIKMLDRIANLATITEQNVALKREKYIRYARESKELFIPLAEANSLNAVIPHLNLEILRVENLLSKSL